MKQDNATRTQETTNCLRVLADRIDGLGLDGVWLSLTDVRVGNADMERRGRNASVDETNIHRATHISIDRYGKSAQAFVGVSRIVNVPVMILRDIHSSLDSVWTQVARATRDLPMPLRKELFSEMRRWREAELDEKRARIAILDRQLAELQEALD